VKPCKIIQRKSECDEERNKKNYSRLKLNGIEFGFFREFFLSYQQIRHTCCSLGHTIQFQRQKISEEKNPAESDDDWVARSTQF
jgi:hypothetical protein